MASPQPPFIAQALPPVPQVEQPIDQDCVDLDTRIERLEQQLIARERRLRLQAQALRERAGRAAESNALMLRLIGAAAVSAGVVWAWRRRKGASKPPGQTASYSTSKGATRVWLNLLPLAWPMLPVRWRNQVNPAMTTAVLGMALPLIGRLLAHRSAKDDVRR